MTGYPHSQYQATQVQTATPPQLVLLLYDGAIRFTGKAKDALQAGRRVEAGRYLGRALDIVAELSASLNPAAGEVARNLFLLYDFWSRRMVEAQVSGDAAALESVLTMLRNLREAWGEAAAAVTAKAAAKGANGHAAG